MGKNFWVFLIFMLSGIVIGGLLGELATQVSWLWWLGYGQEFGMNNPFYLDLSVLKLTFGLVIKINLASIIGMLLSIFAYRRLAR